MRYVEILDSLEPLPIHQLPDGIFNSVGSIRENSFLDFFIDPAKKVPVHSHAGTDFGQGIVPPNFV